MSTPLTWEQLAEVDDPAELNLLTVPDRLADGDPWAGMDDVAHDLAPLLHLWETLPGGELNFPPDYPKMPGEPPRVQPQQEGGAHWDAEGNRVDPPRVGQAGTPRVVAASHPDADRAVVSSAVVS